MLFRSSALDGRDLLERLDSAVVMRNALPDRNYTLGFSVGVAFFDPADPAPIEDLIRAADAEMYQQKRAKQVARYAATTVAEDLGKAREGLVGEPLPSA